MPSFPTDVLTVNLLPPNYMKNSFRTLLTDLSTIVKNRIQPKLPGVEVSFDKITNPTLVQQRALDLLGVSLFM